MASVSTKVLVVDDDPDLQDLLGIYLRQWGYEVARAGSADDGVRLPESYHPDIVLSDVMMPGRSGISLLRTLHAEDSSRPVILMTSYATADMKAQALKHGALDVLSKPLDYPKLKFILEATRNSLKSKDSHRT